MYHFIGIKGAGILGTAGAILGGAIGAVGGTLGTGGTGAVPGAVAGATTGAKWLGGTGYVTGSADYTYKLEAGLQYQTLIDMGVPEDIAREESKDTGAINALIEGGESILDLITFGGVSAIKGTLTKGLVKKYGEKKLLEKLVKFGFECSLRVVPDPDARTRRKMKYPPSAYYILEVDKVLITNK